MAVVNIFKKAHPNPIKLENGDSYDGLMIIYDEKTGEEIDRCHVNTDPTIKYEGGEIAEGEYIYNKRYRDNGFLVFDITTRDGNYILPSKIPNPNHNGKKIIGFVQIHVGGSNWDGSHGCLTIPPEEWKKIFPLLGEKGELYVYEKERL